VPTLPQHTLPVIISGAVFFMAGALVDGQERNDARSRRTVTTTEWPSLRAVMAVEDVRRLLELTEDEQERVREFVRDERPRRSESDDNADVPPPGRDAPAWQAMLERQERRLKAIVGEERYLRIRQLQAQAGGLAGALTRDEPGYRLEVSSEQRGLARKEIRAVADEMSDRFHERSADAPEVQARLRRELYEKVTPKLIALLTDEQKQKWNEMVGEPADEMLLLKIRATGKR
jgi:hypothetical protein